MEKAAHRFATDKIRFTEKLAFAAANLGNIPIMTITGSFLLIFYTNVIGLNPAACATLFLIARMFDAVTDPVTGFILDHLKSTRYGHFRPTLAVGSVMTALNFMLVFVGPYLATSFRLGIAYITYLLLGVLFDVMDISLNSLLPVMTTDMGERTSLSTIKGMIYMVGSVVLNIAAPLIVGNTSAAGGYLVLVIGASIFVIVLSVFGSMGVKERVKPATQKQYKFSELGKILLQKPVCTQFLCMMCTTIGTYISQTLNLYFFTYIIPNLGLSSLLWVFSIAGIIPGMLLSGMLAPKVGKKVLFTLSALTALSSLLRLFAITNIPLLIISTLFAGFGAGLSMPLGYGMQADNTDYVELATGHRTEAAVAALSSFVSKFGMGIGGSIPGYLLAWAGYNASLQTQNPAVISVIIICVCIAPAISSLIGAAIMWFFYPLSKKKLEEQVKAIQALHDAQTESVK